MAQARQDNARTGNRFLVALESFVLRHRRPVSLAIHIFLFALALLLAHVVRFEIAEATVNETVGRTQQQITTAALEALEARGDSDYESLGSAIEHSFSGPDAIRAQRMIEEVRTRVGDLGRPMAWTTRFFLPWLPIFIALKLLIFGKMKLFRGAWHYSSIRDVGNIVFASWVFLVVMVPAVWISRAVIGPIDLGAAGWGHQVLAFVANQPTGVLLLDFFATVFLVCTARLGFRLYHEEFRLRPKATQGVSRVILVGAGNAAETVIREISRMTVERYRVIGVVDDDPAKKGITIYDVPVLGRIKDLPALCDKHKVDEVLVAIPHASQKQLRRVIDICNGTQLRYRHLPGITELIDGRFTVSQIRPVDINDLLGREAVELDLEAIARFIEGRALLITGAGGSIGSEMCRQVCKYKPKKLLLVEQSETPLFDIENELRKSHPDLTIIPCVCDIYDRKRVMSLWREHRPDVVVHAAAHKHVPLMEHNPCEAVKNNILGTKNVADACCEHGASEFVLISTDKAVNPSSVMGASKRVAEIYIQALNGRDDCQTQFKAVRFGNVLGSNGSVVPTFRRQIDSGGPVTVTHPDMTRYFMTIPEAAQLVLQAAATGTGGQIFLLDMGEPVKIVDLARNMITLSGFRAGEDIDIVFTGCRPGEKLFEELRTEGEDIEPTVHPKVLIWQHRSTEWDRVSHTIEHLTALANCTQRQKVVDALVQAVPEYEPLNPPSEQDTTKAPQFSQPEADQQNQAANISS
jgi:FlaA1/EpsC-like NDP-sugar epimerase